MIRLNGVEKSALTTLVVQVLSKVIKGTLVPAILGPVNYGSLSIISTLSRVSRMLDFGAQATLITYGANELEKKDNSFRRYHSDFSSWFVVFVIAVTIATISLSFLKGLKLYLALVIIIFILSSRIRELVQNIHQINGFYSASYKIQTWFSLNSLVLIPIGGFFFDWPGVLVGTIISELLATAMKYTRPLHLSKATLLPNRFMPNQKKMFVLNGYDILYGNIDSFVIFSIFSISDYGKYAFGTIILWIFELIFDIISTQYVPEMSKSINEDKIVKTRLLLDSLVLPFIGLTVVGSLLLPFTIKLFFEDYSDFIEVFLLMFSVGAVRTYSGIVKRFYISRIEHVSYFLKGGIYPVGMLLVLVLPFEFENMEVVLSILFLNVSVLLILSIGKGILRVRSLLGLLVIILFAIGLSTDNTSYLFFAGFIFIVSRMLIKDHVVI